MKTQHTRLALACMTTAMLAACGGGGGSSGTDSVLSTATAQGYSADAATMPVSAATSLDGATATLEQALAASASSAGAGADTASATATATTPAGADDDAAGNTAHALAATPLANPVSVTRACAGGGTITWSITGGTLAQQLNGQLDAGESYDVVFVACAGTSSGTSTGATLDGRLTLAVTARSSTTSDFTLSATALQLTGAQGSTTLSGSARSQRSTAATAGGGTLVSSEFTASALTLVSGVNGRQASYQLKSMDWTVVRTLDASGALVSRTHKGSLDLAATTTRRPAATLQISSQGGLTLGSDGLATSGSLSVVDSSDKYTVTYVSGAGSASVTLTLDLGNNGSIDATWTLPRGSFHGDAG